MLKRVLIAAVAAVALIAAAYVGVETLFLLLRSDWILSDHFVVMDRAEAIELLELRDAEGRLLWVLENAEAREIREIDYGVVPDGLVQRVPAEGRPRDLERGEELDLLYFLPEGRFVRISMRPVGDRRFHHGTTVSGEGCDTLACVERLLRLGEPWRPPEPEGRGRLHEIRRGETLAGIASGEYGSRAYVGLIASYNGYRDAGNVRPGDLLRLPPLSTVLSDATGEGGGMSEEVTEVLRIRRAYAEIQPALEVSHRAARMQQATAGRMTLSLSSDLERRLSEAGDGLAEVAGRLRAKLASGVEVPSNVVTQLEKGSAILRALSAGSCDRNGYDLDLVHQRFALVLESVLNSTGKSGET